MNVFICGKIDISPLLKGQKFLHFAILEAKSPLEKAGAIQAFEICYELAWKFMKRILDFRGINVASPREVFRAAAQEHLIDDLGFWFEVIRMRNLTTHAYNQNIAEEIFSFLSRFGKELDKFVTSIRTL